MIAFILWGKKIGVLLLGIAQCRINPKPIKLVKGQPIKLFQERGGENYGHTLEPINRKNK
jgi:hypothetical protein